MAYVGKIALCVVLFVLHQDAAKSEHFNQGHDTQSKVEKQDGAQFFPSPSPSDGGVVRCACDDDNRAFKLFGSNGVGAPTGYYSCSPNFPLQSLVAYACPIVPGDRRCICPAGWTRFGFGNDDFDDDDRVVCSNSDAGLTVWSLGCDDDDDDDDFDFPGFPRGIFPSFPPFPSPSGPSPSFFPQSEPDPLPELVEELNDIADLDLDQYLLNQDKANIRDTRGNRAQVLRRKKRQSLRKLMKTLKLSEEE